MLRRRRHYVVEAFFCEGFFARGRDQERRALSTPRTYLAAGIEITGHGGEVTGHSGEVTGHSGEVTGHSGEVTGHSGPWPQG